MSHVAAHVSRGDGPGRQHTYRCSCGWWADWWRDPAAAWREWQIHRRQQP